MCIYIYICVYICIYTYTHIHTHIECVYMYIYIYMQSWFCIQRLSETKLIDIGSAKPTWRSMLLPLFNGFFEGCE